MRRTLAFTLIWRLIRFYSHLIICCLLLGFCIAAIWRNFSSTSSTQRPVVGPKNFRTELHQLEEEVFSNRAELARLRKELSNSLHPSSSDRLLGAQQCPRTEPRIAKSDYNIYQVIDSVEFTNVDGGKWTQGWPIKYDPTQWDGRNKLKVFVVPHSHNDPGWLKTFEKYYLDQTKNILNNMVTKMFEYPEMKFIWAEISFFARWFETLDDETKKKVALLAEERRLEFVTGGWVMNDEANTHYYAMIEQLVLGHEWLAKHLPTAPKPVNGWAIDPFGLSPTMAYLLKGLGLKHMVIQRIHYFLKKHLARSKALEFNWRQPWDVQGDSDMFCHAMPFYSYDAPHSCGPDPAVCCQFDFHRLRPSRVTCPWKIPPQRITDLNVAERAMTLLDQYRMKAQLYQTNSLLVPLGDDFRYDKLSEWDNQYQNYKKLMEYINNKEDLATQIQFATLDDYFSSVDEELRDSAETTPSLVGDFFTYADKKDEYWSGYYTSRPYYKFLDRRVESTLRTAEILYSMASAKGLHCDTGAMLTEARRGLSLFQHHDGITGTAKTHVMQDYGLKLAKAVENSMNIIKISTEFLLSSDGEKIKCDSMADFTVNLNGTTEGYSNRIVLDFAKSSYNIAVVNSLISSRREIVSVYTTTAEVTVVGTTAQLSPVFDGCKIRKDLFELSFLAELRPFEVKSYIVTSGGQDTAPSRPSVTFYQGNCDTNHHVFHVSSSPSRTFQIQTNSMMADFSAHTGLITRLNQNAATVTLETTFWKFSTPSSSRSDRSGAYLFMPEKSTPTGLRFIPSVVVAVRGALLSEVSTVTQGIQVQFRLKESPGIDGQALEIHNIVDISREVNFELLMKVASSVKSNSIYTDLNGFNYVERRYQRRIPVQGNVYPMSAMVYLQDEATRISMASAQPLGVTDLGEKGAVYVFLDRRLNQDDNRGLAQTVTDNIPALSSFRLSLESQKEADPRPSLLSLLSYHSLTSPLLPTEVSPPTARNHLTSSTLQPCGVHVVNVRSMAGGEYLLTMLNEEFSCSEFLPSTECQITSVGMDLSTLLGKVFGDSAQHTSLSDMYPGDGFSIEENLRIPPNEMRAVKLTKIS